MLSFGGLATAVAGVLLLGALLRADSPGVPDTPARTMGQGVAPAFAADPPPAAPGRSAAVRFEPTAEATAEDPLTRRVARDLNRLARRGPDWTAQLAILCRTSGAEEVLGRFETHSEFYLLPAMHEQAACFRVCWGRYPSQEAAKQASDLPDELRALQPAPLPKSLAEVLE